MSWYAWLFIAVGTAVLAYVLSKTFWGKKLEPGRQPDDWPESDEAQEWDERAAEMRKDYGLSSVSGGASRWAASIAALLGLLSTVAFVAGPKDLADVGGWEAKVAATFTLVAAGLALVSLGLAVMAEQGSPQWSDELTGWTLKSLTKQRADLSAKRFLRSRQLVVGALLLIVVATAIAWGASLTGDEKGEQNAIVVMPGGAVCGSLNTHDGALTVNAGKTTQSIPDKALITLIDSCP